MPVSIGRVHHGKRVPETLRFSCHDPKGAHKMMIISHLNVLSIFDAMVMRPLPDHEQVDRRNTRARKVS